MRKRGKNLPDKGEGGEINKIVNYKLIAE